MIKKKDIIDEKESQQPLTVDSEKMINEPTTLQQPRTTNEQKIKRFVRKYKIPDGGFGRLRTLPEKRYHGVPTVPIIAQVFLGMTDEMIIINYFNWAHLRFDPTILQQATMASQQIAQDFRDYFHPRYLRRDPHCTEELTAVFLSWMCDYY
uniref:Uncharacterized protein n=1 Tax=Romanomermis culicivorax TaxID=13658 RepID=A0A915IAZ0_ROMCU